MKKLWQEIRNDFEIDNNVYIDAWKTYDNNEEGNVIAIVNRKTKEIKYFDERAKNDKYAQDIIKKTLSNISEKVGK